MTETKVTLPKEYISVSQINCYLNCPQQYKKRYVDREQPDNYTNRESLILGSAVHKYIEHCIKYGIDNADKIKKEFFYFEIRVSLKQNNLHIEDNIVLNKMLDYYNQTDIEVINYDIINAFLSDILLSEDYKTLISGHDEELKTKTVHRPSYLELFLNITDFFKNNKDTILSGIVIEETEKEIEFNFEYEKNIYKIKAFFDAIGMNISTFGKIVIDWKTAKRSWAEGDVIKMQDVIYSYLANNIFDEMPEFRYVIFVFSEKTGDVKLQTVTINHTKESIGMVEQDINEIIHGITTNNFFKNEGSWSCSENFCEYFNGCQAYKNNIKVNVSKEGDNAN